MQTIMNIKKIGPIGAIIGAGWLIYEGWKTFSREIRWCNEYEKEKAMQREEEKKYSAGMTEDTTPVIVPDEVEDNGDYMEWRRKHHPTWIDKVDDISQDFVDSGGMAATVAIALNSLTSDKDETDPNSVTSGVMFKDKVVGNLLNTAASNMGKRALVREQGTQQRHTESNRAWEVRKTHSSKTDDEIRKLWAEERIRQQGKKFDDITLPLMKQKAGLYTPPAASAANGAPAPAMDTPAEAPRKIVYSGLGDIASNPENRVRPILGNWLKQREITFIVGGSKTNKTTLGVQMAIDLCDGEYSKLFDCKVLKQRVYYLSYELSPEQWGERYYKAADLLKKKEVNIIPEEELEKLEAFSVEGTLRLCRDICDGEIERGTERLTIFIDNFTLVAKNPGSPTAKECKALHGGLKKLIGECKRKAGLALSIVVVGHTEKEGKKIRGSSVMADLVDSIIFISPFELVKDIKVRDIVMKMNRSLDTPEDIQGQVSAEPYLHLEPFDLLEYIMRNRQASEEEAREEVRRQKEQVKEAVNKLHEQFKREAAEEWKKEAEEAQEISSMELPSTEQSAQLDSASDEPQEPSLHEWTAVQWRDLDKAEQRALYYIIIRESESGTANKEIARKIQERFGVTVQESKIGDFVNTHKKGEVPNVPEVTTKRGRDDIKHILMDYYPDGESYWDSLSD